MVITDQCQAKNVLKLFQPTYPIFSGYENGTTEYNFLCFIKN
jgi:hypothetical protein